MPTKPTKWIMVDDTSPEINYLGPTWFAQEGQFNMYTRNDSENVLNSHGERYKGTTHGTRNPASFTFNYTGSQFEIVGTIDRRNNAQGLNWHCFVDGKEVMNVTDINTMPFDNNWFLCGDPDSPSGDGTHTFVANINATTEQPFWFDWMRYAPTADVSLENRLVRYDRPDPAVVPSFSPEWDMAFGTTTLPGAEFNWEFIGTSFAWYGSLKLVALGIDPPTTNVTMGTYQIDDGPKIPFYCPMVGQRANWWNQKFFETTRLPMAKHKISVVYAGGIYPLVYEFFLIQNGTLSELNASPSSTTNSKLMTIILASVIPVVVITLIIVLAWYIAHRRKKRRHHVDLTGSPKAGSIEHSQVVPTVIPYPSPVTVRPVAPYAIMDGRQSSTHSFTVANGTVTSSSSHPQPWNEWVDISGSETGGLVPGSSSEPDSKRSRRAVVSTGAVTEAPPSYEA